MGSTSVLRYQKMALDQMSFFQTTNLKSTRPPVSGPAVRAIRIMTAEGLKGPTAEREGGMGFCPNAVGSLGRKFIMAEI